MNDFVKWFCEHGLKVTKVYLHTDNPVQVWNEWKDYEINDPTILTLVTLLAPLLNKLEDKVSI